MLSFVVVVAAVVLDVAGDRTGGQPEASTMASTSEMRIRNGSPSGAAAITRLSFVIWLLFFCVRVFVCLCVCVCVCVRSSSSRLQTKVVIESDRVTLPNSAGPGMRKVDFSRSYRLFFDFMSVIFFTYFQLYLVSFKRVLPSLFCFAGRFPTCSLH